MYHMYHVFFPTYPMPKRYTPVDPFKNSPTDARRLWPSARSLWQPFLEYGSSHPLTFLAAYGCQLFLGQRFFWVSGTTVLVGSLLLTGTAQVVSAPSCRIGFAAYAAILRIGMFGGSETLAKFGENSAYIEIALASQQWVTWREYTEGASISCPLVWLFSRRVDNDRKILLLRRDFDHLAQDTDL